MDSRPRRGSTENEPEEPERTKNKERTRKEKPLLCGRYPVYAVPFRRYLLGGIQCRRYPFGGTFRAVMSVGGTSWRYWFG